MLNDLKCLPMNFYLLTVFDACLNCIFRVALKAISWASGKRQLNYTLRKGNVFYYVDKRFFIFVTFLTFLTFFYYYSYLNVFTSRVLYLYLPENQYQHYHLRQRQHNNALIPKTTYLSD